MNFLIKIANFLGMFNKAKLWLQGKKTYVVNSIQMIGGIGAMLTFSVQVLDLFAKSISVAMGWGNGSQSMDSSIASIKLLWSNHAVIAAGFSAGFYAVTDACSKIASYAAAQRRHDEIINAAQPAIAPVEVKP